MRYKVLKNILALVCAAVFCMAVVTDAYAFDPPELYMQQVTPIDNGLRVYCATNAEAVPETEDFSATLGNTAFPVTEVVPFADLEEGASFIFLVDVSGSIKTTQLLAIKETLTAFCAELTDKDNISVCAIGDTLYAQPFVSGWEAMKQQIDGIERSREDTSLYESIFAALAILNSHEKAHDKKVLVVFSDGEEDSFQGITIDEAALQINESHIPIYTIAMLGKNPASRYVETAKTLGSFARLSAGGKHFVHTLEDADSIDIANGIFDSIKRSLAVTVDLSGFQSDGRDLTLRFSLNIPGVGTARDGYMIPTAGLSFQVSQTEIPDTDTPNAPETTETVEIIDVSPTSSSQSSPNASPPNISDETETSQISVLTVIRNFFKPMGSIGIVAIIVVFMVLVVLACVFGFRRIKYNNKPIAVPVNTIPATGQLRPATTFPPSSKVKISLRLTKIGSSAEQVYRADFSDVMIIGRDATKATLVVKDDERLSARHCAISYEPEGVVLNDLGSTNGTFVNGIPISERYLLENDDILLVGSSEFRVHWSRIDS